MALCRLVDLEFISERVWGIMKSILKSRNGQVVLDYLVGLLDGPELSITQNSSNQSATSISGIASSPVLATDREQRAAVMFIGMAVWSPQRIDTLNLSFLSVMPSLLRSVRRKNPLVIGETALSMKVRIFPLLHGFPF